MTAQTPKLPRRHKLQTAARSFCSAAPQINSRTCSRSSTPPASQSVTNCRGGCPIPPDNLPKVSSGHCFNCFNRFDQGNRNGLRFAKLDVWRRFSQPLQKIPRKARVDFAGLIHFAFLCRPRFRGYSAPKADQSKSKICARLLKTLGGEVPEWFNGSVC